MAQSKIPYDMQVKLTRILEMDLNQLNEAYIKKMLALKRPIVNDNQPTLEEIYRVLIPEIFELAARRKAQGAH